MIEYVDHLHEHFLDPVVIRDGALRRADAAGLQRRDAAGVAGARYRFPDGDEWRAIAARRPSRRCSGERASSGRAPDAIDEYERLHAEPWPGRPRPDPPLEHPELLDLPRRDELFAYFEYVGDDFAADMAAMAADPETQRWWALTDAMQEPFPDREPGSWWKTIREVFHTD